PASLATSAVIPRPPSPPLFPYTTLFRSGLPAHRVEDHVLEDRAEPLRGTVDLGLRLARQPDRLGIAAALEIEDAVWAPAMLVVRSEEHTSELQSRENLVCRLLLQKKTHT